MNIPSSIRVVLAGEENSTFSFIQLLLASMGYDVEVCHNSEVIHAFRGQNTAIAVLDLDFAGLGNSSTLEQIRRTAPGAFLFGYHSAPNRLAPASASQLHALIATGDVRDVFMSHFSRLLESYRLRTRLRESLECIVGHSAAVQHLYHMVEKAAQSRGAALIRGESGVGKELVARAIASTQPKFVVVNCSAIPENLFESELFGHVRGAFTGANADRIGLFEEAAGGCLFLDEIGDMPTSMQTKLLRALQEGEIRPVGANINRKVRLRVIAATNRDLETDIKEKRFREDLYYRLNVIPVRVPPLRERREDIPDLVSHFLTLYANRDNPPEITAEAWRALEAYEWPGNIRELENVVHRAVALMENHRITSREIQLPTLLLQERWQGLDYESFKTYQLAEEREFLSARIRHHGGSVTRASEALGLGRTALHNRAARIGLDLGSLRNEERKKRK
jgi:two-component system, NtrC family, response regulator PilR